METVSLARTGTMVPGAWWRGHSSPPSGHSVLWPKVKMRCEFWLLLFGILPPLSSAQEFEEGHNFCDPNPCRNGGSCRSVDSGYLCSCPAGAIGYSCETNVDDCAVSPASALTRCQTVDRNARCVDLLDGFLCECAELAGDLCDIPVDDFELVKLFPHHNDSHILELIGLLLNDSRLFPELVPFLATPDDLASLSWEASDLFVWASFAGQQLDLGEGLVRWHDPSMGNCFTFGQSARIREVVDIGQNYGFQALLRVRQEEYLPWVQSASLNVFVRQKNEHILPTSAFFSTPPGSEAQLLLSQRSTTRLGGIYGQCANGTADVHTFYFPGLYTVDGCLQSCYQNQVHLVCGCTDPRFRGIPSVAVCGPEKAMCVLGVSEEYGEPIGWDSCECPAPCSETTVDGLWYSADFAAQPVQCWNLTGTNLSQCTEGTSEDQVLLSVFFKNNAQEEYEERPSQTFNDWLFKFGGITGIIAGFCFISIIEFVFFLYRFLTFCTNEFVTKDAMELQFVDEEDADFDVFVEPVIGRTQQRAPKRGEEEEEEAGEREEAHNGEKREKEPKRGENGIAQQQMEGEGAKEEEAEKGTEGSAQSV